MFQLVIMLWKCGRETSREVVDTISRYSGKCDVYDSFVMIHNYTDEELKNNAKVYLGKSDTPLKLENMKDLIPYYPHLISVGCYDNTERKSVIHITSKSFVDIEEQETLEYYLNRILTIYNRCKRKKIEFNVDDVVKEICWSDWNKEAITELVNRVKETGKKATIDGIHLTMHERYRRELVKEMIKNNIDPTKYGYGRFVEDDK